MAATTAAVVGAGAAVYGASQAGKASGDAADAQSASNDASIAEQRRQYDNTVKLLSPYVNAGNQALDWQRAITGIGGEGTQQYALSQIENSPYYQAQIQSGENGILQNASATGGLRGGNVQGALAQFRPQLLNQLVQQQYQNLSGISTLGQNSAAQTASAGQNSANQISNQLGLQGQAQAGGIIGQSNAINQGIGNVSQLAGLYAGANNTPYKGAYGF